jgi:hypothetical protein
MWGTAKRIMVQWYSSSIGFGAFHFAVGVEGGLALTFVQPGYEIMKGPHNEMVVAMPCMGEVGGLIS